MMKWLAKLTDEISGFVDAKICPFHMKKLGRWAEKH
jgi:hypothetical protein